MKTIKIEDKYYIPAKVVMLPVEYNLEKPSKFIGSIFKNENGVVSILNDEEDIIKANAYFRAEPQYLYYLSDEGIKEGDWVLDSTNKHRKVIGFRDGRLLLEGINFLSILSNSCKKIIATTNPDLKFKAYSKISNKNEDFTYCRPTDEFIQQWIAKGTPEEIEVEYEVDTKGHLVPENIQELLDNFPNEFKAVLKINQDNTINCSFSTASLEDDWDSMFSKMSLETGIEFQINPIQSEWIKKHYETRRKK